MIPLIAAFGFMASGLQAQEPRPQEEKKLSFTFKEASPDAVFQYVSRTTSWIFVLEDPIPGKITAYSDVEVPLSRCLDFLNTAIRPYGFVVVNPQSPSLPKPGTVLKVVNVGGLFQRPEFQRLSDPEESTLRRLERDITAVVERVRPSVVQVTARFDVVPSLKTEPLAFSGVVYSRDGYVVTDASAVESTSEQIASEIEVRVGDRVYAAEHVSSDRRTGVAVLRIAAKDLTPAVFADAPPLPGAFAITVGNAFGVRGSISVGTVSGFSRCIVVGGRRYEDMIQMSVPVHPGDCGGFVADSQGRLLGLAHSASASGSGASSPGLLEFFGKGPRETAPAGAVPASFATPAEGVKFAADRIIKHGRMVRGRLGVTVRPLDEGTRAALRLGEGVGVRIVAVDGEGPAGLARLAPDDILVEFDGAAVKDIPSLQKRVAGFEKPSRVRVVVFRSGERRELDVEIQVER